MRRYNPKEIEPKWQKVWRETGVYTADLESDKPKYIGMSMLNYPSGAGIHIGHAMNYTISDVKARFKRQQGYESYHPIGWDAFGLPAENYAIKSGVSPQESMANIIPMYHKQYQAMGWSNDWEKEISTHLPEYYKWTQWLFGQMYKNGLVYQENRMQWWCTKCQTVLANEQVIDGKCWRHEGKDDPLVERKEVKQWFFKITDYADELLDAIDDLDWTESVKLAQKNWIGRSKGAEVAFAVELSGKRIALSAAPGATHRTQKYGSGAASPLPSTSSSQKTPELCVKVFTTRADTIFGATFLVLAPEHPLVNELTSKSQESRVKSYVEAATKKSELERQENKDKTGVFTGAYAINPASNEKIPIWIADYVLMGYGTGAIMAVPAHDERDHEFAKKFNLPIVEVVAPDFGTPLPDPVDVTGPVIIGYDPKTKEFMSLINSKNDMRWFASGGLEDGETYETAAYRELGEEAGYHKVKKMIQLGGPTYSYYYNSNKDSNRRSFSYMFLAVIDSTEKIEQHLEAHEKYRVEWSDAAAITRDFEKEPDGRGHWIDGMKRAQEAAKAYERGEDYVGPIITGEGVLFNSGKYNGLRTSEAREKIVADLASREPQFGRPKGGEKNREAIIAILKNPKTNEVLVLDWGPRHENWGGNLFIGGGIEVGEDPVKTAEREIAEETGYVNVKYVKSGSTPVNNYYYSNVKNKNYHAHILPVLFELIDDTQVPQNLDENENQFSLRWVKKSDVAKTISDPAHLCCYNILMANKAFNGQGAAEEKVNYRMRDWSVSRQRYWGAPIPIINCPKCGPVLVPDADLPVILPELTDYEPAGDGRSALARATDWVKTTCPKCHGPAERETDTLDTYVDSSFYMLRYLDPHNQEAIFGSKIVNKWAPIDFYNGGDHATAHMLYARFITRFFNKIGLIDNPEPFKQFLFNGKVMAHDGAAFSKTLGNGPDPLEIIGQGYGADALRTYLMFAAPLELSSRCDPQGVPGTYRFLNRLWNLVQEFAEANSESRVKSQEPRELLAATHRMIKKVTGDIEGNRYNTAIAAMMECVNDFYKVKVENPIAQNESWRQALESLVACVAPFAPFMADELWQQLGHSSSVHKDTWPKWDEKYLASDTVTIAVQINGKLRGQVEVSAGSSQADVEKAAKADQKVRSYLTDKPVIKIIYVDNRLLNFVVR